MLINEFNDSVINLSPINIELRIKFNDNDDYSWYLFQAKPEKSEKGNILFYGYLGKIDELKESQLKAIQAKEESERANQAKSDFLSNIVTKLEHQ